MAPALINSAPTGTVSSLALLPSGRLRLNYPPDARVIGFDAFADGAAGKTSASSELYTDTLTVTGPVSPSTGEDAAGLNLLVRRAIYIPVNAGDSVLDDNFGRPDTPNPLCGDPCAYNQTRGTILWGYVASVVSIGALDGIVSSEPLDSTLNSSAGFSSAARDQAFLTTAESALRSLAGVGLAYRLTAHSGAVVVASSGSGAPPREPVTAPVQLAGLQWELAVWEDGGWEPAWLGGALAAVFVFAAVAALLLAGMLVSRRRHAMLLEALLPRDLLKELSATHAETMGPAGPLDAASSPAGLLLGLLGDLMCGAPPDLRQVVTLRSLALRQADWYRPLGLVEAIQGANMETDVARALMRQLGAGVDVSGTRPASGAEDPGGADDAAGGGGGGGAPGIRQQQQHGHAVAAAGGTQAEEDLLSTDLQQRLDSMRGALAFVLSDGARQPPPQPPPSSTAAAAAAAAASRDGAAAADMAMLLDTATLMASGNYDALLAQMTQTQPRTLRVPTSHSLSQPVASAAVTRTSGSVTFAGMVMTRTNTPPTSKRRGSLLRAAAPPPPPVASAEAALGSVAMQSAGQQTSGGGAGAGGGASGHLPLDSAAAVTAVAGGALRQQQHITTRGLVRFPSGEVTPEAAATTPRAAAGSAGGVGLLLALPPLPQQPAAAGAALLLPATLPTAANMSPSGATSDASALHGAASASFADSALVGAGSSWGGGRHTQQARGGLDTAYEALISQQQLQQMGVAGTASTAERPASSRAADGGSRPASGASFLVAPWQQQGAAAAAPAPEAGAGRGPSGAATVCSTPIPTTASAAAAAGASSLFARLAAIARWPPAGGGGNPKTSGQGGGAGGAAEGEPSGSGVRRRSHLCVHDEEGGAAGTDDRAAAVGAPLGGGCVAVGVLGAAVDDVDDAASPFARAPAAALLDEVEALLAGAHELQFDSWALAAASGGHALSVMGFYLLQREGLVASLRLQPVRLARLLRALEEGYPAANPYHNATHAADVLRTLSVLLRGARLTTHYAHGLGLLAAYFAAIVHDHGHPGLTGDFLVATSHPLALRYNDRSPLESHHAASAFTLLAERPDLDPFGEVSREQRAALRKQVIDMVLATDMKQHFSLLSQFEALHKARRAGLSGGRGGGGGGGGGGGTGGGAGGGGAGGGAGGGGKGAAAAAGDTLTRTPEGQQQQPQPGHRTLRAPNRGGGGVGFSSGSNVVIEDASASRRVQQQQPQQLHTDSAPPQPHDEAERSLALQIALKAADIGHLAGELSVHCRWLGVLEEEFFRQGDRERALGLPISPLFDRSKQGVSKSQVGFFDFVALPLLRALADAFPGAAPMAACFERNYVHWKAVEAAAAAAAAQQGVKEGTKEGVKEEK
ncbi:hypothetical protein HXX76_014310 [Chlamydomonas incerta]|uniref:PDEase domain-containing protein n=1 Tax=Chlamydomonas incerta TaxID=51695 RepID=A0A835VR65_CHLIN|nr:hypothetical protein HXX76_014310 [Chlamydomonas incerta]|eukprot:KAG2424735.1 hypothetical protein HXX76_014310 [Chlamydomonas incerta]